MAAGRDRYDNMEVVGGKKTATTTTTNGVFARRGWGGWVPADEGFWRPRD